MYVFLQYYLRAVLGPSRLLENRYRPRQSPCGSLTYAIIALTHGFTVATSSHSATVVGQRARSHGYNHTLIIHGAGNCYDGCTCRELRSRGRGVFAARASGGARLCGTRRVSRCGAGRALARAGADTRPRPSVAMAKRPGSRARPPRSLPNHPDASRYSPTIGVNKPAAHFI